MKCCFSYRLLLIITLDDIKSLYIPPSSIQNNAVKIHDFRLPADVGAIPNKERLLFYGAVVDMLPYNFTEHFDKCIFIKFESGSVKVIHINEKLTNIELLGTYTENVIIQKQKHYQLESFVCNIGKLTRIPKNMNQLKKLNKLELSNNLIESVQMDQFDGLNHLKTIDLSSNNIKHIYSHGSVSLPLLTGLNLNFNHVQRFDVCSWNMPSLSFLELDHNNLIHFPVQHFRKLQFLYIDENPLNCAWKDSLLKSNTMISNLLSISCDEENMGSFGLDCSSRFTTIEERLSILDEQFSNMTENFQKIESHLENLGRKMIEQENVSNNIIESMYRIEIERASQIESLLENLGRKMTEQENVSNNIVEAMYRMEMERASQIKKET